MVPWTEATCANVGTTIAVVDSNGMMLDMVHVVLTSATSLHDFLLLSFCCSAVLMKFLLYFNLIFLILSEWRGNRSFTSEFWTAGRNHINFRLQEKLDPQLRILCEYSLAMLCRDK